jgi:hypothetical protein
MSTIKTYRSEDGRHVFTFRFVDEDDHVDIYCLIHPSLNGRASDAHKTHLFGSGKICFVAGREPHNQNRAEELAKQWAEFFLRYRKTGITES